MSLLSNLGNVFLMNMQTPRKLTYIYCGVKGSYGYCYNCKVRDDGTFVE